MPPKGPADQPQKTGSSASRYAGMIVLGVIAGVLIAWGFSAARKGTPSTATNASSTVSTQGTQAVGSASDNLGINTNSAPAIGADPGFTIMSPQTAGSQVVVYKAIVSQPTWIVVYDNKGGQPGNALGAALFFPEVQSGTVELLRPTLSGKSYLAVKQVDNGDRKFQLHGDQFLSEGGEVQWVTFEVR